MMVECKLLACRPSSLQAVVQESFKHVTEQTSNQSMHPLIEYIKKSITVIKRMIKQAFNQSSNQPITEAIDQTCSASHHSTIRHPSSDQPYFLPLPRYASCVHQDGPACATSQQVSKTVGVITCDFQAAAPASHPDMAPCHLGRGFETTTAASASPQTITVECNPRARGLRDEVQMPWRPYKCCHLARSARTSRPKNNTSHVPGFRRRAV